MAEKAPETLPQSKAHPRRLPAHKSVSLLHSPKKSSDATTHRHRHGYRTGEISQVEDSTLISSRPPKPDMNASSGESSNTEPWFEALNNDVHPTSISAMDSESKYPVILTSAKITDTDDPPFFLRNSSSSETPPDPVPERRFVPYRAGLMHAHAATSSSEDFRSVIDDLTIENKKLKRRLRKYEKMHDSHLQPDKLFEIRMHGLSAEKKRELEATLRSFAMSLEATPHTASSGIRSERFAPQLHQNPTVSSLTSSKLADSAYASMSGQVTSAPSGQASMSGKASNQEMSHQQHQNVRSYLHEIPAGLLPKHPVVMTEKARRKLIVRRLEQLFAGKGAAMEGHQHPLQQEEVAQSAARADRSAIEACGHWVAEEGAREARIVPSRTEDPPQTTLNTTPVLGKDFVDGDSPEQRPTRPLDLDPERAQVPAENIQYMRHLGFSPPDIGSSPALADGHGWIYLNVLTNMAQIHDVNVTSDFVKKAIAEHSQKLELSHDARKVRWRGGSSLTRTSSDGSPDQSSDASASHLSKAENRNKGKQALSIGAGSKEGLASTIGTQGVHQRLDNLAYIPLFSHREESSEDSSSDANMSGWSSPLQEDVETSATRPMGPKRRLGENGPIIFYNNASFCTDLSGDVRGKTATPANASDYFRAPTQPIGLARKAITPEEISIGIGEPKGPLSLPTPVTHSPDAMDIDQQSSSSSDLMVNSIKPASLSVTSSEESTDPLEFEASGLGGVHPTDNFSINVRSRQKVHYNTVPSAAALHRNKMYPSHIRNLLADKRSRDMEYPRHSRNRRFSAEVISSKHKDLPASALPPASFYPSFDSPDSDDDEYDDSDADSETSNNPLEANRVLQPTAPHLMNWPTLSSASNSSSEESEEEDDDDDDEDEGSIDMLVHARQAAPAVIRAQEREYDGNIADRLAEEIPAGSSAATAGGGSGFNSPEFRQLVQDGQSLKTMTPLKRARTSDDRIVLDRKPKSPKYE
jgi:hypothetical protein